MIAVLFFLVSPAAHRRVVDGAHGHLCEHGKDTDEDDRYDHQAYVLVADMRQLVCNDRFQFGIVQFVDDSPRETDGIGPFVDAACKSIQRIVVDDIDLGHFHPLAHTQVLH